MPMPERPRIYHIVHLDRLAPIVSSGGLFSDAEMAARPDAGTTIGMEDIKTKRLQRQVPCHPGTVVGDYVPFYYCPRSVMLYVIAMANHQSLEYRDGQGPIVHLESDLHEVIDWADANDSRWAFSLSNAAASYTLFRSRRSQLDEINWDAVTANDWRRDEIMAGKQAEFLLHRYLPWSLVTRIGVISSQMGHQVRRAISTAAHKPTVQVMPSWYY